MLHPLGYPRQRFGNFKGWKTIDEMTLQEILKVVDRLRKEANAIEIEWEHTHTQKA